MSFDAGARLASPGSGLPGGTVTFAFTDIEASTALLRRLGDRYAGLLAEHRRIVRTVFGGASGVEIDRQGDAFFFAFPRSRDAVGAAVDVQRAHAATAWPDGVAVRVRIGLHTGEPAVGDEGYLGIDVVRAARICTVARGGQVLVSETTRALAGSTLPDGVAVRSAGERRFKDLDEPECIYELVVEGLEPSEAARSIEARLSQASVRVVTSLGERVAGSFEDVLESEAAGVSRTALEDAVIDDLAARAITSFEGRVRAGVGALRRSGIPLLG